MPEHEFDLLDALVNLLLIAWSMDEGDENTEALLESARQITLYVAQKEGVEVDDLTTVVQQRAEDIADAQDGGETLH